MISRAYLFKNYIELFELTKKKGFTYEFHLINLFFEENRIITRRSLSILIQNTHLYIFDWKAMDHELPKTRFFEKIVFSEKIIIHVMLYHCI